MEALDDKEFSGSLLILLQGGEELFYSDASSFWVTLYNLNCNVTVEGVDAGNRRQLFAEEKVVVLNEKQLFGDKKTVVSKKKQLFEKKINESRISTLAKEKILRLYEQYSDDMYFSRADVMRIAGITSSPAGELIKKMKSEKLIVPVVGHGKGRYRFNI